MSYLEMLKSRNSEFTKANSYQANRINKTQEPISNTITPVEKQLMTIDTTEIPKMPALGVQSVQRSSQKLQQIQKESTEYEYNGVNSIIAHPVSKSVMEDRSTTPKPSFQYGGNSLQNATTSKSVLRDVSPNIPRLNGKYC